MVPNKRRCVRLRWVATTAERRLSFRIARQLQVLLLELCVSQVLSLELASWVLLLLLLPEFLLGFLVQVSSCLSLSLLLLPAFVACVCCLRLLLKFHLLLELCFFQLHLLSLLNFVPLIRSLIACRVHVECTGNERLSFHPNICPDKTFFYPFSWDSIRERDRWEGVHLIDRSILRSRFRRSRWAIALLCKMSHSKWPLLQWGVRISIFQHTHFKIFENISRTFQNVRKVLQATL